MAPVTIKASRNGPYLVKGSVELVDAKGKAYSVPEGEVLALCRCGQSKDRPFCDGTHADCGFSAEEAAP